MRAGKARLSVSLPRRTRWRWVMQSFKQFPRLADVPVIVLTALSALPTKCAVGTLGPSGFLKNLLPISV
jgi:hypothetical protein